MPRVRTDDKTEAILASALRRFLHYGLKKTSMQEVARDAGIAVGTLYLYFEDKDDLVVGCAERFAVEHREQARALLASKQRADKKLAEYVRRRYAIWQEVGLRAPHAEELANAILRLKPEKTREFVDDFTRHVAAILNEGKTSGVFRDVTPERDAAVLALSVAIFFPVAGREHPVQPGERELELVVAWFIERFKGARGAKGAKGASHGPKRITQR
jgi:AcrR family transcriptional regulator